MLVSQMKYECDAWRRSLEYMEFENNLLLEHLATLLKIEDDESFIENAEFYQAGIISEHEGISSLRKELDSLSNLLLLGIYENGKYMKQTNRKYKQVKRKMEMTEERFYKMKEDFNSYVAKTL